MHIRVATVDDAPELLAIYAPYVEGTAITAEYEVPTEDEFRGRIAHMLERYPYLVAVSDESDLAGVDSQGRILGYSYVSPLNTRAAYDQSVETSIYVSRDARGRGVGRALHDRLVKILTSMNVTNMCACISATQAQDDPYLTDASIRFHERMGYRMVGRFDGCQNKFGRWYDMVWMERVIARHVIPAPKFKPFPTIKSIA